MCDCDYIEGIEGFERVNWKNLLVMSAGTYTGAVIEDWLFTKSQEAADGEFMQNFNDDGAYMRHAAIGGTGLLLIAYSGNEDAENFGKGLTAYGITAAVLQAMKNNTDTTNGGGSGSGGSGVGSPKSVVNIGTPKSVVNIGQKMSVQKRSLDLQIDKSNPYINMQPLDARLTGLDARLTGNDEPKNARLTGEHKTEQQNENSSAGYVQDINY